MIEIVLPVLGEDGPLGAGSRDPATLRRIRMGEASLEEQIPGYVYAQNNMM
jgi:hypothetical protein